MERTGAVGADADRREREREGTAMQEEKTYKLSDIVIEGIELTEEYKELLEKEKRGEITAAEIGRLTRSPYIMKK